MSEVKKAIDKGLADDDIVHRVVAGEGALYELIMRRYNARLYKVGRAYICDNSAVEDVMQETYIKAYQKLNTFRFESLFSTWLTRIMVNEALQYLRKQKHYYPDRPAPVDVSDPAYGRATEMNEITTGTSPEKKLLDMELKTILERCIDEMPENYRVVYVLREVEGLSIAETMQLLHLGESNVKIRLNRAKEILRSKILKQYEGAEIFDFHLSRCNRLVEEVMKEISKFGNE